MSEKKVGFYSTSTEKDTSFYRKYRISVVPETILINGNGVVEKVWLGELNQSQIIEITNLMCAKNALVKQ